MILLGAAGLSTTAALALTPKSNMLEAKALEMRATCSGTIFVFSPREDELCTEQLVPAAQWIVNFQLNKCIPTNMMASSVLIISSAPSDITVTFYDDATCLGSSNTPDYDVNQNPVNGKCFSAGGTANKGLGPFVAQAFKAVKVVT